MIQIAIGDIIALVIHPNLRKSFLLCILIIIARSPIQIFNIEKKQI